MGITAPLAKIVHDHDHDYDYVYDLFARILLEAEGHRAEYGW